MEKTGDSTTRMFGDTHAHTKRFMTSVRDLTRSATNEQTPHAGKRANTLFAPHPHACEPFRRVTVRLSVTLMGSTGRAAAFGIRPVRRRSTGRAAFRRIPV